MNLKEYMREARQTPEEGDKIEYMSLHDKMLSNVFVNSQRNSASVCCTYDADATAFMKQFQKLKQECDYHLTLNAVMLKVLVEGLKAAPRLNAHYQYNHFRTSGRLVIKKHIDVSMAICKQDGTTFQMKLQQLEDKSLKEIAQIAEDARRRLEKADIDEVMFEVSRQRIVGEMSKGKLFSPLSQALSACVGKGKVIWLSKTLKSDFLKIIGKKSFQPDCDVKIQEFNEGTVCFTNWGAICESPCFNIVGGPVLYPQVFLFSMGRLREEKIAYEDEDGTVRMGEKFVLPLGFSFDHKIGGAYDVKPFVERLDEIFREPEVINNW